MKKHTYSLTEIVRRFNASGKEVGSTSYCVRSRELACGHTQKQGSGGKAEAAQFARCFTCYPKETRSSL